MSIYFDLHLAAWINRLRLLDSSRLKQWRLKMLKRSKSIIALHDEFERAHFAFKAIRSSDNKRWTPALDRCHAAAQRIVKARAETIAEMLIKSRAIVWLAESLKIENIATWHPNKLLRSYASIGLASLGKDLTRIARRLNLEAA
jgi:hypothetical protein